MSHSGASTHSSTHTRYACARPLPRQVCLFYYTSHSSLFNPILPSWAHQSALVFLGEGNCLLCTEMSSAVEVQLHKSHQGARNNIITVLNSKLLGMRGHVAFRLTLNFSKRMIHNFSSYSSLVHWGQEFQSCQVLQEKILPFFSYEGSYQHFYSLPKEKQLKQPLFACDFECHLEITSQQSI